MTAKNSSNFPSVNITPTFPIDFDEVDQLRKDLVSQTPKYMLWQNLALIGTHFTLLNRLSRAWSELQPQIDNAVVEHVIKQSNEAQDEVIRTLIRSLRYAKWDVHASRLQEVLWTKQRIELALDNRKLATQRADFEILVDSIVQELCNETLEIVEMQSYLSQLSGPALERLKEKVEVIESRIEKAVAILLETEKQVTVKQQPHPATKVVAGNDTPALEALVDALAEEIEVSKKVDQRLDSEFSG